MTQKQEQTAILVGLKQSEAEVIGAMKISRRTLANWKNSAEFRQTVDAFREAKALGRNPEQPYQFC